MRIFVINVPALLLAFFLTFTLIATFTSAQGDDVKRFGDWQVKFGKSYKDSASQKLAYQCWTQNDKKIVELNAKYQGKTTFGHTQFSDLSPSEFQKRYLTAQPPSSAKKRRDIEDDEVPSLPFADDGNNNGDNNNNQAGESAGQSNGPVLASGSKTYQNWTKDGHVTPVKDQGNCGSCWAFSTTGVVESAYSIKHKKLLSLSEEELVDCTHNGGNDVKNFGCGGGYPTKALEYVYNRGGLSNETAYPYLAGTFNNAGQPADCKNPLPTVNAPLSNAWTKVAHSNAALIAALDEGPVSIVITGCDFQCYHSGILYCTTDSLNHAVLATGYEILGKDSNGKPYGYYMVKNSWGTGWGEYGYVRLEFSESDTNPDGNCGILYNPVFPTVV